MFIRPKHGVYRIEDLDPYISRYQVARKRDGIKKGDFRIVAASQSADSCWIWKAAQSATKSERRRRKVSYGVMFIDAALADHFGIESKSGKRIRVHQLIYHCYVEDMNEVWKTNDQENHQIAHKCHNSLCCRPDHLELANREKNSTDRVRRKEDLEKKYDLVLKELAWWRKIGSELGISYDVQA
jgi:hypothetical protein